jgi:chromosome segregation ATPase
MNKVRFIAGCCCIVVALGLVVLIDHSVIQNELTTLNITSTEVSLQRYNTMMTNRIVLTLTQQITASQDRISMYQKHLNQLREENERFSSVITKSSETIKDLTATNAKLRSLFDDVVARYRYLNSNYENVIKDLDEHKKVVKRLTADKDRLTGILEKLSQDLQLARKQLTAARQELKNLATQIIWYQNEYERVTGGVAPLPPGSLK